jgi:hypothetical protein
MRRSIGLIAIVALAATASVTGAASAHRIAHASTQRFTFSGKTISGKNLPIHVTAIGPISGHGTARLIEHPNTTAGTFLLPHGNLQLRFVHGPTQPHLNPAKCRATIDARGTYTINGGTGRYTGATGKGTYTETRLLIGQRSPAGKCLSGQNSTPKSVTAVATMIGTVSLR